jgi:two-component system OmpR family response regulator
VPRAHPAAAWARPSTVIKHGPLTFDATGRVAYINDQMIELLRARAEPARGAAAALGPPGQQGPARRAAVRVGREVSNNAIEVYIHRLRKKIEQGPVRIATVRGLGYCLEKIPG